MSFELVLTEGTKEVGKEVPGSSGDGDGLAQSDEDGMTRLLGCVVAFVEHGTPGVKQAGGSYGVGYFVPKIVRDAAVSVDALKVGADAFGQKEGGDVEVLIMRVDEPTAPGLGLD